MSKKFPSVWDQNAPDKSEANPLILYRGRRYADDSFAAALAAWLFFEGRGQYVAIDSESFDASIAPGRSIYALGIRNHALIKHLGLDASRIIVLEHEREHEGPKLLHGQIPGMAYVDPTKSCARLAWDYFHPDHPAPALIRYVEDRALWRWRYPETKSFTARLDTEPQTFPHWSRLLTMQSAELMTYLSEGARMREMFDALAEDIVRSAKPIVVTGKVGRGAMAPRIFRDAVIDTLATQSEAFGLAWAMTPAGDIEVALRGAPGFDVLALGEPFGAVGHSQFCLFHIDMTLLPSLLDGSLTPDDCERMRTTEQASDARQQRRAIFFGLWTQSVDAPHYDKNAWRTVHNQLTSGGLLD